MDNIIITTTPSIEGHPIKEYLGLVSFRCCSLIPNILVGNGTTPENFSKHENKVADSYRDFIKLQQDGLKAEAAMLGANAVVGVSILQPKIPSTTIILTGTAVIIE